MAISKDKKKPVKLVEVEVVKDEEANPETVVSGPVGGEFSSPDQEYKAIGVVKLGTAVDTYSSFTLTIKNNRVIHVEASHPHLKPIAIEEAKVKFVKAFLD
jgi:hypothetical protein